MKVPPNRFFENDNHASTIKLIYGFLCRGNPSRSTLRAVVALGLSQKSQTPFPKLKKYDSIKGMKEQIFKPYQQNQPMLLPPNLDEMIPPGHIVRVVNNITDGINIAGQVPIIQ
jgi:hypothetical protein